MTGQTKSNREKVGYILFFKVKDDQKKEVILFVKEFEENVDAEELKAKINNAKTGGVPIGCHACVGVAHFEEGETENLDVIRVTPKDGSNDFLWGEMIDVNDLIKEEASENSNLR